MSDLKAPSPRELARKGSGEYMGSLVGIPGRKSGQENKRTWLDRLPRLATERDPPRVAIATCGRSVGGWAPGRNEISANLPRRRGRSVCILASLFGFGAGRQGGRCTVFCGAESQKAQHRQGHGHGAVVESDDQSMNGPRSTARSGLSLSLSARAPPAPPTCRSPTPPRRGARASSTRRTRPCRRRRRA